MKNGKKEFVDPFLRHLADYKPKNGLSPFDCAGGLPGPNIPLSLEMIEDHERTRLPKYHDQILCKGAALGVDDKNRAVHFWPGKNLRFAGFLENQDQEAVSILSRGSVFLRIPNIVESDCGRTVYAYGPNKFGLEPQSGAAAIGKIRFVEKENIAAVFFKRPEDPRPENLNIRIQ